MYGYDKFNNNEDIQEFFISQIFLNNNLPLIRKFETITAEIGEKLPFEISSINLEVHFTYDESTLYLESFDSFTITELWLHIYNSKEFEDKLSNDNGEMNIIIEDETGRKWRTNLEDYWNESIQSNLNKIVEKYSDMLNILNVNLHAVYNGSGGSEFYNSTMEEYTNNKDNKFIVGVYKKYF